MGFINGTPNGKWRANWRDPQGKQKAKTFRTKTEAKRFLVEIEAQKTKGAYVSPYAGRVLFGDHAQRWMQTWNTEQTTAARDSSIMKNHVMPQWGAWPLFKIDHMAVQGWISNLEDKLSRATIVECHRLTSAVLASAVANKLISFNPAEGVRLPRRRKHDTDERIISREDFRRKLLPAVPDFYRGVVAAAGGAGLRWGEAAGLCLDALNLDAGTLRVIRTVVEVSGQTWFKPFPKTGAGRRTIPLPPWLIEIVRAHLRQWPPAEHELVFANMAGKPLRRTLFRSRVWKPSLVRAGLLGSVDGVPGAFCAQWTNTAGERHSETFPKYVQAVRHVAKHACGGPTFHDLRHSYATWLVDDGVPVNMVQRVMGHERASTTLDIYTRRTSDVDRILEALSDDDDGDDPPAVLSPV